MTTEIVGTAARPDLAEVSGAWRWEHFLSRHGHARDAVLDAERTAASTPLPHTLVLVVDGRPVGMASLAAHDLDQRPKLGPWLAGVWVEPDARGRGHATRLIGAVEDAARARAVDALWLYTRTAEPLYRRLGWRTVEPFERLGRRYVLMRRDLGPSGAVPAEVR